MPKKILKKTPNRFFDPVRTALSPEAHLLQYLAQTTEILSGKSADTLLKEAEDVFKKTKQINNASRHMTKDQLDEVILKALAALTIAAEKYKLEKKDVEAACVYQLIVSQADRHLEASKQYEAPRFR